MPKTCYPNNLKVLVIDDRHPMYGKELFVKWIREYKNSKGEDCTWYHCNKIRIELDFARYYLGKSQIEKL